MRRQSTLLLLSFLVGLSVGTAGCAEEESPKQSAGGEFATQGAAVAGTSKVAMCNLPRYTRQTSVRLCGYVTPGTDASAIAAAWFTVDAGAPLSVVLGSGGFVDTATSLPEGTHIIRLYARSDAGNVIFEEKTVTVDVTPPVLKVLSPISSDTLESTVVDVTSSVTDATPVVVQTQRLQSSSVESGTGTVTHTIDLVNRGCIKLVVRATDAVGNVSEAGVYVYVRSSFPRCPVPVPLIARYWDGARFWVVELDPSTLTETPLGTLDGAFGLQAQVAFDVPNRVFYTLGSTAAWTNQLYKFNLDTGVSTQHALPRPPPGDNYSLAVVRTGGTIVALHRDSSAWRVVEWDPSTLAETPLGTLDGLFGLHEQVAFDVGRDMLFVVGSSFAGGPNLLYTFDLKGSVSAQRALPRPPPGDNYSLAGVRASGAIVALHSDGSAWRVVEWDPSTLAETPLGTIDGLFGLQDQVAFDVGRDMFFVVGSSFAGGPNLLYTFDLKRGISTQRAPVRSNYSLIAP